MTEQAKFLPSVVGLIYDWLRFEDYLGNVGSIKKWGLSQITEFWGYHGTYAQEPAQQI